MSLGCKPMSLRERAMADFKRWQRECLSPCIEEYAFDLLAGIPVDYEELRQRYQRQYLMSKEVTTA